MAGSHGVAVSGPRVHPRAQQRLKEVHVQRLAAALPLILCTSHAWDDWEPSLQSPIWRAQQSRSLLEHHALAMT